MSDAAQLEIRGQIARIDRAIEETRKFTAEPRKLQAERQKLAAEPRKSERERWLVIAAMVGAVGGLIAAVVNLGVRLLGFG